MKRQKRILIKTQMNEIGQRTFFWYRVYCGVMVVLYLAVMVFGIALATLATLQPDTTTQYERYQVLIIGIGNATIGVVFFLAFVVALFLPPKPYNWIVGFVMMGIGMTSCCFIPFVIPLLIFWIKPETQAFFGRRQ